MTAASAFSSLRAVGITAAFGLLASCSVLQVDVDVYKGPLANHKDVQTEQLAVMAVGAEPLIRRLHDELVNAGLDRNHPLVQNVSAIQTLYTHRERGNAAETIVNLLDLAKSAAEEATEGFKIFDVREVTESQLNLSASLGQIAAQDDERKELAKAFKEFIIVEDESLKEVNFRPSWGPVKVIKGCREECFYSANEAYSMLSDEDLIGDQAEMLFPEGTDEVTKEQFELEIGRISNSFLDSRESLHDLFRIYLEILSLLPDAEFEDPEGRTRALYLISTRVAETIQPLHMFLAVSDHRGDTSTIIFQSRLNEKLKKHLVLSSSLLSGNAENWIGLSTVEEHQFASAIREVLLEWPEESSKTLLAADERFISSVPAGYSSLDPKIQEKKKLDSSLNRKFGLSGGPVEKRIMKTDPKKLEFEQAEISATIRSAIRLFEAGRIDDGLYAVIEDYLNASHKQLDKPCEDSRACPCKNETPCNCPGSQDCSKNSATNADYRREILLDVLTRFAQKTLFVVNHERLFAAFGSDKEFGPLTQTYIQVLQTVGNSILVHVDALRQLESHEAQLREATEREVRAIRNTHGAWAGRAFSSLVNTVNGKFAVAKERTDKLVPAFEEAKKAFGEAETNLAAAVQGQTGDKPVDPRGPIANNLKTIADIRRSLGQDPSDLNQNFAGLTTEDEKFGKKIEDEVVAKTKPDDIGKLIGRINVKINDEINAASSPDRVRRLKLARSKLVEEKFEEKIFPETNPPSDASDVWGRIKTELKVQQAKLNLDHEAAGKEFDRLTAAFEGQNQNLQTARTKLQEAKERKEKAEKPLNDAKAEAEKLATAVTEMIKQRASVVDKVNTQLIAGIKKPLGVGEAVRDELILALAEGSTSRTVVSELAPPLDVPVDIGAGAKDAKDVLDELIAVLRHRHTDALSADGLMSDAADRAAAALAESYRQRADMVYLRPAMAYLRTSFTATTLQDNRLAWRNLLAEHGFRTGVPFLPELIAAQKAKVTEELDKQFWHNINRVRVAGAGDTNYAIVKDDLGNWYVKNYSTNVDDIIESAQNLGLFAANLPGTELVPPEPSPAPAPPVAAGEADPPGAAASAASASTPETKVLSKQHQLFADKFEEQSLDALQQAKTSAGTLESQLKAAWVTAQFSDEQRSALDSLSDVQDNEPLETQLLGRDFNDEDGRPDDLSDTLVKGLRAIKLYHDRVLLAVQRLPSEKEDEDGGFSDAERVRASKVVSDVVLVQTLSPLLKDSTNSADQYETALQVIGQTSGL